MNNNQKRTQLNINISPDLLKFLKSQSIKSGKTLGNFINEILSDHLNDLKKSNLDKEKVLERINNLEGRIDSINATLLVNQNATIPISEKLANNLVKNYYKEVQNIFNSASKQNNISNSEFYYLLSNKVQSKGLNLNYELIMDIFRGQITPSVKDVKQAFSFRGYLDCYEFLINCGINLPKSYLDKYDILFKSV